MFSFLNRNKNSTSLVENNKNLENNGLLNEFDKTSKKEEFDEIKKNLYTAITLRRIDIVVSILNEWFKSK